jgi:hypothetical protein
MKKRRSLHVELPTTLAGTGLSGAGTGDSISAGGGDFSTVVTDIGRCLFA